MQQRLNQVFDGQGHVIEEQVSSYSWAEIRAMRAPLLAEADIEVNKAGDNGEMELEAAWRAYRVALRNVPQSFETPDAVEFPDPPAPES